MVMSIGKEQKNCPIENIIKNWDKNMDLLLLLKKNDEVLGYQGKGDFSLEEKNKKFQKLLKVVKTMITCLLVYK